MRAMAFFFEGYIVMRAVDQVFGFFVTPYM